MAARNRRILLVAVLVVGVLVILPGCTVSSPAEPPAAAPSLPAPDIQTTRVPPVEAAAEAFFQEWQAFEVGKMHARLTSASREKWPLEQFSAVYTNLAAEAGISSLEMQLGEKRLHPQNAETQVQIIYHTALFGDFTRSVSFPWAFEHGEWKLAWEPGLALPELGEGGRLGFDRSGPGRGDILDQAGLPFAAQVGTIAIGVWPDYADLEKSPRLPALLDPFSDFNAKTIYELIRYAEPGAYVPIGEVPRDFEPERLDALKSYGSVVLSEYTRRLYYAGGAAPHVVGYVGMIQPEELLGFQRQGYRADDLVGRLGIEQWGEAILNGKPGGKLYVFNPQGQPQAELGSAAGEPSRDIYLTLKRDFQSEVQKALSIFDGAIVVLEVDSGRVLAMASSPGFDPNIYSLDQEWGGGLSAIPAQENQSQFNRATEGQYPLGSVFKLITISAALESGRYNQDSTLDCGYDFTELAGVTLHDWTWDHFQEDGKTKPSGLLTLPQGLVRSCNPWFWHIGLDFHNSGAATAVSDMARSFGLGSPTGIEGIVEQPGYVPDPLSPVEATNLAIGEGDLLVTPLQAARFIAALANGGVLYRPQLIEKFAASDGSSQALFQAEEQGRLPLTPEHLALIQEAMRGVIYSQKPEGTAFSVLSGLDLKIAGKTGTAAASSAEPHAWFAGFSEENREDLPDIAVVVVAEYAGEGSQVAAPIFRRVMELYFFGEPKARYPWEATFYVTRSPTPDMPAKPPTRQPGLNP